MPAAIPCQRMTLVNEGPQTRRGQRSEVLALANPRRNPYIREEPQGLWKTRLCAKSCRVEETVRTPRYPILIFTLVGALLVFVNDTLTRGVMNLALGPNRDVAGILANVLNWIGPGIWLLALALCFLLTIGSVTPPWTRGRWRFAIVVFYLFHLPLVAFLPPAIFGRWGYAVYLFLGAVGAVCATWLLLGSFHLAAVFLLAEPVVRSVLWGHLHYAARIVAMTLFAVVGFPLIGWWLRDAAASHSK